MLNVYVISPSHGWRNEAQFVCHFYHLGLSLIFFICFLTLSYLIDRCSVRTQWNECEPEKRKFPPSISETFRAIRFIYAHRLFSFLFLFKVGYEIWGFASRCLLWCSCFGLEIFEILFLSVLSVVLISWVLYFLLVAVLSMHYDLTLLRTLRKL
jgi:hypothetical protein